MERLGKVFGDGLSPDDKQLLIQPGGFQELKVEVVVNWQSTISSEYYPSRDLPTAPAACLKRRVQVKGAFKFERVSGVSNTSCVFVPSRINLLLS